MMNAGYELVDHTADIGVHAWGHTREEVFELAAEGMFSLICDPMTIATTQTVDVEVDATQPDLLLAAWLNELLFRFEAGARALRDLRGHRAQRHARSGRASAASRSIPPAPRDLRRASRPPPCTSSPCGPQTGGWDGFVLLDV